MASEQAQTGAEQGLFVYPESGWRKWLFKAPLVLVRAGLGQVLPPMILVLTTTGRKSGQPRYTALEHSKIDGRYYAISAWGTKANWYRNALVDPLVTVQTGYDGVVSALAARVTEPDELRKVIGVMRHSPIWQGYLEFWKLPQDVDSLVEQRERLHILRMEPADDIAAPPPLPEDLTWVWIPVNILAGLLLLRALLRWLRGRQ